MPVSREVRAAIGDVVIETTWIEYLVARLAVMARRMSHEDSEEYIRSLLMPNGAGLLFKEARSAIEKFGDSEVVADRTRAWLDGAEALRKQRNDLVHSITMHEHRPGFTGYQPKGERVVAFSTRQVVDLAKQVHVHSDEGTYISLFDWPVALGLVVDQGAEDGSNE